MNSRINCLISIPHLITIIPPNFRSSLFILPVSKFRSNFLVLPELFPYLSNYYINLGSLWGSLTKVCLMWYIPKKVRLQIFWRAFYLWYLHRACLSWFCYVCVFFSHILFFLLPLVRYFIINLLFFYFLKKGTNQTFSVTKKENQKREYLSLVNTWK